MTKNELKFVEGAYGGGFSWLREWKPDSETNTRGGSGVDIENKVVAPLNYIPIFKIYLDPKAWVAFVRNTNENLSDQEVRDIAQTKMHMMVDSLFNGLTIDEFIENI